MKSILCVLSFLSLVVNLSANVLVVEGNFQYKNIYVQNSFGANGVGFCTTEIKVNGKITTDEVNSSAFEIDLSAMNFKFGQKVVIEINHKNDCVPVVLNAEVLKPRATFEIVSININSAGFLQWTSKSESGSLPYVIEQFKWNKWVTVGEVQGIGSPDLHNYSFQIVAHSGENSFRLKQVGIGITPKVSSVVTINSKIEKTHFMLTKNHRAIQYSSETNFELYDAFGTIVKKGFGKQTDLNNIAKGKYYLCYDNQVSEIKKRK